MWFIFAWRFYSALLWSTINVFLLFPPLNAWNVSTAKIVSNPFDWISELHTYIQRILNQHNGERVHDIIITQQLHHCFPIRKMWINPSNGNLCLARTCLMSVADVFPHRSFIQLVIVNLRNAVALEWKFICSSDGRHQALEHSGLSVTTQNICNYIRTNNALGNNIDTMLYHANANAYMGNGYVGT